MENVLQHDAITLTNIITELTEKGTITNIRSIISAAVLCNLWLLIDGTKYAISIRKKDFIGIIVVFFIKLLHVYIFRFDVGTESTNLKEAIHILKDLVRSTNVSGGILNQFPFLRYIFPNLTGYSMFVERQNRINDFFMVRYYKFTY